MQTCARMWQTHSLCLILMQIFLPSTALIKLMNCYYACITAAEFLVSYYHFLTNQERQQSANTRGSRTAVLDVGKYLCVFCRRSGVRHCLSDQMAWGGRILEWKVLEQERSINEMIQVLYSNTCAESGENGKFAISVQLSSKSPSSEKFKYAKFHQLKPNILKIPCTDLGWLMKEWWQRDKPKG